MEEHGIAPIDLLVVNTETLKANPALGKALTGAWYETMAVMQGEDAKDGPMHEIMASAMGTDIPGFAGQADQTHFFYTPDDAADFLNAESSVQIMDKVRTFSFDEGLFGAGAASVDVPSLPHAKIFPCLGSKYPSPQS